MFAPSFVPAADAVVEGAAPSGAHGTVRFVRDDPEREDLRAELDRPGLVVLNDQLADGWSVTVDGRSAQPLRVDSVMRGVSVPAGAHTVSWRYRAPGLSVGLVLSAVGLLLIAGLALWDRLRVGQQRDVPPQDGEHDGRERERAGERGEDPLPASGLSSLLLRHRGLLQ